MKSYGIHQMSNPLNDNEMEDHLVLEYCPYGSLHSLGMFTKQYNEATAYVVIRQIVNSLKGLHQEKILHLDIKEANVLVAENKEN